MLDMRNMFRKRDQLKAYANSDPLRKLTKADWGKGEWQDWQKSRDDHYKLKRREKRLLEFRSQRIAMEHPESDKNPQVEPIFWLANQAKPKLAPTRRLQRTLPKGLEDDILQRTPDNDKTVASAIETLKFATRPGQVFDTIPVITASFFDQQRRLAEQLRQYRSRPDCPEAQTIRRKQGNHELAPIFSKLDQILRDITDTYSARRVVRSRSASINDLYHALDSYYHTDPGNLKKENFVELEIIYTILFEPSLKDRLWRKYSNTVTYNVCEGAWLRNMFFVALHLGHKPPSQQELELQKKKAKKFLLAETALTFKNKLPGRANMNHSKNELPSAYDNDFGRAVRRRLDYFAKEPATRRKLQR